MSENGAAGPLIDDVADWLMGRALADTPIDVLVRGCCDRLLGAGLPLMRAFLAFRTLHPLISAKAVTWKRAAPVDTRDVPHNQANSEAWQQSPYQWLIGNGVPHLRRRLTGEAAQLDFPALAEFRDQGGTDYIAYAVYLERTERLGRPRMGMVGSWLTDRPGGFTDAEVTALLRLHHRLAVACKVIVKDQVTRNILSAYLGREAGDQVLDGRIKLGDGQTTHAVIWFNDLRGSTALADTLPAEDFLALLNDYFECTAGAVLAHGGEVLRFVGDAVLAIFPVACPPKGGAEGEAVAVYARVMAAATEAEARLAATNRERADRGAPVIDFGLGLHVGDVMFGNIGVPERIEFSVIGPAANEVARIEALTKELGCRVLASTDLVARMPASEKGAWRSLGRHGLRGVGGEREVFAPAGRISPPA